MAPAMGTTRRSLDDAVGQHPPDTRYCGKFEPLKNTGHSVELSLTPPVRSIVFGGQAYNLAQVHFHYPSEHIFNGERFALELHLVHATDDNTKRAVVGVFIRAGANNPALDALFGQMTSTAGMTDEAAKEAASKSVSVDNDKLNGILPGNKSYVTYPGSLTTPTGSNGCDENVTWLVLTTPITASQTQIDKFKGAISYNHPLIQVNARPWQAATSRSVSGWSSTASTVNFTSRPNPALQNVNFIKGPGAEPIAEAPGWRLRAPGTSHMDFQFNVAGPVPQNGLKLTMRHISSTNWPQVGFSPIDITVNNRNPAIKANYDVSASAGGSRDYQHQQFVIPAAQLQTGQNTLRVTLQRGARTHYWIEWLVIE